MTSLKRPAPADAAPTTIASKTFVRTTRSGKVQKVVREIYLRQDISCSSQLCQVCRAQAPRDASGRPLAFVLSAQPAGTRAFPGGHYLVPDTNCFLTGMDLMERSDSFHDVVVLQTVLEEVRHRSLPLYNRLVALTRSQDKRFHVFFNEFRLETFVARTPGGGESINDRNDRAVRQAVAWYGEHLGGRPKDGKGLTVVLLSNDGDNVKKARAQGLAAVSLAEYVQGLEKGDELLDMLPETQDETVAATVREERARKQHLYPDHLTLAKMMTGVRSGLLHQGTFSVSPYNYLEGSVRVPAFAKPLLLLGRENMNRAVDGDVVVVEMLPREQWKQPSTKLIDEETVTRNAAAAGDDDDEDGDDAGSQPGRGRDVSARERKALQEEARKAQGGGGDKDTAAVEPTARVVGIVRRNWRQYVGHVDRTSVSGGGSGGGPGGRKQETVFVLPMDRRVPKIRLRTRQAGALLGQRIVVALDGWDRDGRHPTGHLVRTLGALETQAAETEALLLEYDVQYRPFPRAVLDCLPAEGHAWRVPAREGDPAGDAGVAAAWNGREDLRDRLVCSIDPIGCQDIDDALHARPLPNGHVEVGVHIADVSHFVRPGTAMDAEAAVRGTTVYLVDKRIDMLPMLLGTDLCSLKPHVERFAFSVLWEMHPDTAEVVGVRFTKSVIASREAFSYEEAQLRIDDASRVDPLTNGIRTLLRLSRCLRQKRLDAGALSLSSPEVKVHVMGSGGGDDAGGSETADPVDVETKTLLDTNSLVEEFMLLANTAVAARVYEAFPQTALLRRHAAPPATNFDELSRQLLATGHGVPTGDGSSDRRGLATDSSAALAASLDACVDPHEPYFNTLVRILATRCMTAAEYFPAGALAYPEFRHYGLATPIYTHFTSPIRRYADLVVHRQLAAAIGYVYPALAASGAAVSAASAAPASGPSLRHLSAVCRNINMRHRNAQLAGRASIAYYVGQAVRGRETTAEGFVLRVFSNGFVVLVPRFGIESPIRLRDLVDSPSDAEPHAIFDPDNYTLEMQPKSKTGASAAPLRIRLFQKVLVRITDHKDETTGKRSARMELVGHSAE